MTSASVILERAARLLADRLGRLEAGLQEDGAGPWTEYRDTAGTLAAVLAQLGPERRGALLTTAQLAERLGVTPKTVLKRKARGELRPAIARGKFIRWRGDEGKALTPPNGRVTDR